MFDKNCISLVFALLLISGASGYVQEAELNESKPESVALQRARKIANWLKATAVETENEVSWPIAIENDQVSHNLYSGTAGVLLFFEQLQTHSADESNLRMIGKASQTLRRVIDEQDVNSDPGLFSGYSGYGFALLHSLNYSDRSKHLSRQQYHDSINRCVELLSKSAIEIEGERHRAITWNHTTDVISGSAGIGTFLLAVSEKFNKQKTRDLAIAAADGLLAQAKTVEIDGKSYKKWMMNPEFKREMPNYSHGTAGVCDFLLAAHEAALDRSRDEKYSYHGRFLKAAIEGANYLQLVSLKHSEKGLIPHHFPDGEKLFYLGWCHGPVGTCRLFERINQLDQDKKWIELNQSAIAHLKSMELEKTRTPGFWNNVGICCGSAGVASFFLDQYSATGKEEYIVQARRLAEDIISRAELKKHEDGFETLFFPQAEHRVRPELIQSQTGLMQGAAGVGLMLLQLHEIEEKKNNSSIFNTLLK